MQLSLFSWLQRRAEAHRTAPADACALLHGGCGGIQRMRQQARQRADLGGVGAVELIDDRAKGCISDQETVQRHVVDARQRRQAMHWRQHCPALILHEGGIPPQPGARRRLKYSGVLPR